MLKGLTVQYLLRQTYELKGGETVLFHAAAGGVGSIACQWAKALGVKLIGTVSSAEKAAHAKALGAWETIDYSHEDVAQRVLELTGGKKVPVVYDGVGKDTWLTSLDSLAPRGLMVSFGNASMVSQAPSALACAAFSAELTVPINFTPSALAH